jgi:hypothetical protein
VARLCSPGDRQCSNDYLQVLVCDTSGTSLEIIETCADDEACSKGICEKSTMPLGQTVRVTSSDGPFSVSPGRYAVVVVNTDTSNDEFVDYPLHLDGSISDPVTTTFRHLEPQKVSDPAAVSRGYPMSKGRTATVFPRPGPEPNDAETRTFFVPRYETGGEETIPRTATLRASGQHVRVWEDQSTSSAGTLVPDTVLDELMDRLDHAVLPRAKAMVGEPTDVDGNGKIDILFTDVLPDAVKAFCHPSATLFAPGTFSVSYDYGEVVYAHGIDESAPVWETSTLMSHEVAQLIVLSQRLEPFLSDPESIPPWVEADIYAVEGLASLVMGWSGQSHAWPVTTALEHPQEASLARLTASSYLADATANLASYGFGTLVQEYLFDQAGAMVVSDGGATIQDGGGKAYLQAFTAGQEGWDRIHPLDGRPVSTWYVDFATALLLVHLDGKLAPSTAKDPRTAFAPTVLDTKYGGFLGPTLRWEHVRDSSKKGPIHRLMPWSQHPASMRRGGLSFLAVSVGDSGATMQVSEDATTAVWVRHRP